MWGRRDRVRHRQPVPRIVFMALTNAIWGVPSDPDIVQASTDAKPLTAGNSGRAVVLVKKALEQLGYERGLDKMDVFGPATATIVTDFQDLYNLPRTGVVGRLTLETIDKLLNGNFVTKNAARTMVAPNPSVGAAFARSQIGETRRWVLKACNACDTAYKEFWQGNEVDFDVAQALLNHFRVITTNFTSIYSGNLGFTRRDIDRRYLNGMQENNRFKVVVRL